MPAPSPTPPKKQKPLAGLLFLLAIALCGLLSFFYVGAINGTEFSPNTFQSRSFRYLRIPGTMSRLGPTTLGPTFSTTELEILKHLTRQNGSDTWHPIAIVNSNLAPKYPAALLVESLSRKSPEGNSIWAAWSAKNPALASTLWPFIQSMALNNIYLEIPNILEFAENYSGPVEKFESELHTFAREKLLSHRSLYESNSDSPNNSNSPNNSDSPKNSEVFPTWLAIEKWLDSLLPPQIANNR